MEEALSNHVVLDNIGEFLPPEDLKNARAVNRLWAKALIPIFRKLFIDGFQKSLSDCERYPEEDSRVVNEDLDANLTWNLLAFGDGRSYADDEKLLNQAVATNALWLTKISKLKMAAYKSAQLNRLLPFLLDRLPCLEELNLALTEYDARDTGMPAELASLDLSAAHKASPVKCLKLDFKIRGQFVMPLDPGFLAQCTQLKTLDANLGDATTPFLKFLKAWKRIQPKFKPLQNISIDLTFWVPENQKLCEALVDFIHWTQPRSLKLKGFEFMDFASEDDYEGTHVGTEGQWTTAAASSLGGTNLKSLIVSFPVEEDEDDRDQKIAFPELALAQLKQCKAFSNITELCLEASACLRYDHHWLTPRPATGGAAAPIIAVHDFERVTSLTLRSKNDNDDDDDGDRTRNHNQFGCPSDAAELGRLLEKVVPHLPNVNRLTVGSIVLHDKDNFHKFFRAVKRIPALQYLKLTVEEVLEDSAKRRLRGIQQGRCKGYWQKLGVLKGLSKLEIKLPLQEIPKTYLFTLFAGYQPHVDLDVEIELETDINENDSDVSRSYNIQLTVDQFREALTEAEKYWSKKQIF